MLFLEFPEICRHLRQLLLKEFDFLDQASLHSGHLLIVSILQVSSDLPHRHGETSRRPAVLASVFRSP